MWIWIGAICDCQMSALQANKKAVMSQRNRAMTLLLSKMTAGCQRHSIRRPWKPQLRKNQTWNGSDHPLRKYGYSKFDVSRGVHLEPPFWGTGRGGRRWSSNWSYRWKEQWWFPICSPLWPLRCLCLTIRPQFAIGCLWRSVTGGWSL